MFMTQMSPCIVITYWQSGHTGPHLRFCPTWFHFLSPFWAWNSDKRDGAFYGHGACVHSELFGGDCHVQSLWPVALCVCVGGGRLWDYWNIFGGSFTDWWWWTNETGAMCLLSVNPVWKLPAICIDVATWPEFSYSQYIIFFHLIELC